MAVMRGNRVGGNWLMKWDEVKNSHGTLIDWRTGRELPVNCMTVISAWWRSNMRFQRSSGWSSGRELLYNSVKTQLSSGSSCSCSRVGDGERWDVVGKATFGRGGPWEALISRGPEKILIRCSKESQHPAEWTPGPPVEHLENEKDTTQVWGQSIAVSVRSPAPSHKQTLSNLFETLQ